jgi:transposase
MDKVSIIGLDLAKKTFQVHGATAEGRVVFRKTLSRGKVLSFFTNRPPCLVAMEACASAHYWAREIGKLGHEVKLIPPIYVKPFVKRQKNDSADAEAIAEAASRPSMRFVPVKTEAKQALGMTFRARDLLVRQRTQTINALRGHLAEFGIIAPQGAAHVKRLRDAVSDPAPGLPPEVLDIAALLLEQIDLLETRISALDVRIRARASQDDGAARLMTIPGVGPMCVAAIEAFAPPMEGFRKGRDFAAWLGLTPRQRSSGGKEILGRMSKMGQRDIRRLLTTGAMAVVRWAARKGTDNAWLAQMLKRKPRMLVAVALANKIARTVWALLTKGGVYWTSATTA